MEVTPGFKNTKVGVIPEDWEIKTLGEIGEALIGLTYKPTDVRQHGTLVLRSSNIQNDALSFDDNVFVDTAVPERIMVLNDDVLICVRNGSRDLIGKSVLLDERTKGMTFGAFMAVYRSQIGKLASYLFQSAILKRQINEHLGATINQITNKSINSFQIPVPPAPEQRSIATALSDVDGLLSGLDRLIDKKRDLKQAAMQKLLTGQARLLGFNGGWSLMKLKELCDYVDGISTLGGDSGYLEIGDINVETKSYDIAQKDKLSVRGAVKVPAGTVLISTVRPTRGAITITKSSLYVSSAFCRVRPSISLFFYLVCQSKFLSYLGENSIGGTYPTCRNETILGYESIVPNDVKEQTAIATIFSDIDDELSVLISRRDKTHALKQAMIQELLTGKTRLV
jgi:type I restriction enzyme S subunit